MTPDQLKRIEAMLADTDGLKECPKCGGEAKHIICVGLEKKIHGVSCSVYGCAEVDCWHDTKEDAFDSWNARAYLELLRALYEEYKRLLTDTNKYKRLLMATNKNKRLLTAANKNKRLREALAAIKLYQESAVNGEIAPGVPAYKMLTCWQIADKALNPPEET